MPKLKNGLTPVEQAFIPEYIKNGFNATQAYLKIKPHVSYQTAMNNSSRLLRNEHVQVALKEKFDKREDKSIATREYLTQQAHDLGKKAEEKDELRTALSAVELKGKLNRIFTDDVPEMEGYNVLIQQLFVNNTDQGDKSKPKVINQDIPDVVDKEGDD